VLYNKCSGSREARALRRLFLQVLVTLKTGFGEFYKGMTRPERRELLHVLIQRIDVGESLLTIHWSFSDDVARISRSKVMPKKGRASGAAVCPVADSLTGGQAPWVVKWA